MGWNLFPGNLGDDRDHENAQEDETADRVAEVHRHRDGIAARLPKRRREDLDNPEPERHLRDFAQCASQFLSHAAILTVFENESALFQGESPFPSSLNESISLV